MRAVDPLKVPDGIARRPFAGCSGVKASIRGLSEQVASCQLRADGRSPGPSRRQHRGTFPSTTEYSVLRIRTRRLEEHSCFTYVQTCVHLLASEAVRAVREGDPKSEWTQKSLHPGRDREGHSVHSAFPHAADGCPACQRGPLVQSDQRDPGCLGSRAIFLWLSGTACIVIFQIFQISEITTPPLSTHEQTHIRSTSYV